MLTTNKIRLFKNGELLHLVLFCNIDLNPTLNLINIVYHYKKEAGSDKIYSELDVIKNIERTEEFVDIYI